MSPTENPTITPTAAPTESPTISPTRDPTENPTFMPSRAPTHMPTYAPPCMFTPCKPVCKLVQKTMTFGGFTFPYTAMDCSPDMMCIKANQMCGMKLQKLAMEAAKAEATMKAKYDAVAMTKANQLKKDKARDLLDSMKDKAEARLKAMKSALVAAQSELASAKSLEQQTSTAKKASDAKMKMALQDYEIARRTHLKAVAEHDGAKSAAAKALKDYDKSVQAHCNAEARHAELVRTLGHPQKATSKCLNHPDSSWTSSKTVPKTVAQSCAMYKGTVWKYVDQKPVAKWGVGPEGPAKALKNCKWAAANWASKDFGKKKG